MKNCLPSSHLSGQSSVRTSFKGKAKMGSDEDELTPLSQLKYGNHGCRVRVRISRIWVSFNPNDGTVFGLDSLLIADKGETMQARVLPKDMKQLEQRLVDGKVYALSDFMVDRKLKNYMTCKNGLMMYIGSHTVVNEIEGDVDEIPLHSSEFVDFGDLSSRNRDNSLLTDVIGQIVYVDGIQQALKMKPLRCVLFREIQIQDLSGSTQNVTLYGDLGSHFDVELVLRKGRETSVIAIFAGTCIRYYNDKGFIVCSTSASKYYLDLETSKVQEFRANWRNPKIPIGHHPSEQESTIDPIQELVLSTWRMIEQLKSLFHNDRYTVPDVIQGVLLSSYTFQVAFTNGQFVVKARLDDDELALVNLNDSVTFVTAVKTATAAGRLLPQEEGSSAFYGCRHFSMR